jgi:hypothetical protein
MLEHSPLMVHAWRRTPLNDGEAWTRPITDGASRPLGFVRHENAAGFSWLFWLRNLRLDVFETDDASHLMSLTRSRLMLPIWEVRDAEDRQVGSIYPKSFIASSGELLGFLDLERGEHGRILDSSGSVLAKFAKKTGAQLEVAFMPEPTVNPFLRMLVLASILTLDAKPKA